MSYEQILERALRLPANHRDELAYLLWASVFGDGPGCDLTEEQQIEVAIRRGYELQHGLVVSISHEEAMRRAADAASGN